MSDFFKTLRSIFIVEESSEEDSRSSSSTDNSKTGSDTNSGRDDSSTEILSDGKVSSRFVDVLLDAMQKNNVQGIDYLEYRQSLDSLGKMEMDDETRFRSAFAMAQTMGADKEKLLSSARHYLEVLKEEEKKFAAALANQQKLKVDKKQQRIDELINTNDSLRSELTRIAEQIKVNEDQITTLVKQRSEAEGKVVETKKNFEASLEFVRDRIREDMTHMERFLKDKG